MESFNYFMEEQTCKIMNSPINMAVEQRIGMINSFAHYSVEQRFSFISKAIHWYFDNTTLYPYYSTTAKQMRTLSKIYQVEESDNYTQILDKVRKLLTRVSP